MPFGWVVVSRAVLPHHWRVLHCLPSTPPAHALARPTFHLYPIHATLARGKYVKHRHATLPPKHPQEPAPHLRYHPRTPVTYPLRFTHTTAPRRFATLTHTHFCLYHMHCILLHGSHLVG